MQLNRKTLIVAVILTNSLLSIIVTAQQRPSSDDIAMAIKHLASPNPPERVAASERLQRPGRKPVTPLVSLLKNFLGKPVPGYIGLREMAAIDILAKLKAQEAVPVFIELMWCCEFEVAGRDSVLDSMAGLTEIGPIAIPELIKAIKGADERVKRISPYHPAWNTEEEKKLRLDHLKYLFRKRAIRVLGFIGDKAAQPFLESLLNDSGSEHLKPYIETAIRSVR